MERVYLEFSEGTSDKFYRIIAVQSGGDWITTAWWGRRGSDGQTQIKYMGPSQAQAVATMHDFANQKRAKGYRDALDPLRPVATSAPAPTPTLPHIAALSAASTGVPRFPAMKARDVEPDWLEPNLVMEEKFDGHRAGLTFNPDLTIVVRNVYGEDKGRIWNMPHIAAHLTALSKMRHAKGLFDGTLIDGELVGLSLAETTHLLGGSGKSDPRLKFVAFDLPFLKGDDLRGEPWGTRRGLLDNLLSGTPTEPVGIAQLYAPSPSTVDDIWARGGEGVILKPIDSRYVPGGRYDWIKVKEHHTAEAIVTGFTPGKGKYAGQVGALKVSQYKNGTLTEVTQISGMTDADRKDMSINFLRWKGQVVEFEYQKKTADSYRHPRYVRHRTDKKVWDCRWETSP